VFLNIYQFLKIPRNKVSQKIPKKIIKFLHLKWGREAPGTTQGDPPCHHTTWCRGTGLAAPWHGVEPLALHLFLHLPLDSHSRKNTTPFLKLVFLLFLLAIFDLLAQPIFAAEIWSNCSLVCDSSDCPSRILFSVVFLEYFSTVGDRLSEFACLFYCLDKLF
jgi:hypothetical protein